MSIYFGRHGTARNPHAGASSLRWRDGRRNEVAVVWEEIIEDVDDFEDVDAVSLEGSADYSPGPGSFIAPSASMVPSASMAGALGRGASRVLGRAMSRAMSRAASPGPRRGASRKMTLRRQPSVFGRIPTLRRVASISAPGTEEAEGVDETVTITELFQYADKFDVFLMIMGTSAAFINGAGVPAFNEVFGQLVNRLAQGGSNTEEEIGKVSLIMVYIGLGVFVLSSIQVGAWMGTAQPHKTRKKQNNKTGKHNTHPAL
jgi:hypothetical protein